MTTPEMKVAREQFLLKVDGAIEDSIVFTTNNSAIMDLLVKKFLKIHPTGKLFDYSQYPKEDCHKQVQFEPCYNSKVITVKYCWRLVTKLDFKKTQAKYGNDLLIRQFEVPEKYIQWAEMPKWKRDLWVKLGLI